MHSRAQFCIWMIRSVEVESTDDLRDLTSAPWLGTSTAYPLSTICHRVVLNIFNRSICFAFKTESFVISHENQADEQQAGYERFDLQLRK